MVLLCFILNTKYAFYHKFFDIQLKKTGTLKFSALSEEHFMNKALEEAEQAREAEELPVGAVVTSGNQVIAKAHNQTEQLKDVTAHAEILAITAASEHLSSKYLKDCTIYVTLEPCPMCASAIHWAQFKKIVFGAFDPKKGFTNYKPSLIHPKTLVKGGIMEEEAKKYLQNFFEKRR